MDESILFSLGFLSQNSLWKLTLNRVYKGIYIYSRVRRNVKCHILPNRVFWRLDLATGLSCEFKPRANGLASLGLLSCSAIAGATLQLLACLAHVQHSGGLQVASHSRVPVFLHNLEQFFTLSHIIPLHDSHLNTGLLIPKIQANLVQNKANKMVD